MPVEYYLGGFVALVILTLLVSMMFGKRSARQKPTTNSISPELTQQLTRIANSLEALLIQLKNSPISTTQPPVVVEASPQVTPPREALEAASHAIQPAPASPQPTPAQLQEPTESTVPEPTVAQPAKNASPSKPHVVLSMFGR